MATLVLTTVGTLVGGPIGGAIGAVIGNRLDRAVIGKPGRQGPRLGDLAVQTSSYGSAIPRLFGTMRVAGTVIWATHLREEAHGSGSAKSGGKTTSYSYSANFAVALSARPILSVGRIWADGKLLRGAAGDWKNESGFRLYLGSEDQPVDPLIASAEGIDAAPAHRGIAYAVFEQLQLADYGNRIPSLTFEVTADPGEVSLATIAEDLSGGAIQGESAGAVGGYAASGDSIRGAIETLARIEPLPLRDDGAVLRLGGSTVTPLAADRLGTAPVGTREPARQRDRSASAGLPDAVAITYYEPARDYQAGLQRARRDGIGRREEAIEVPASLSAAAAKQTAERTLGRRWTERDEAVVRLPWAFIGIKVGERIAHDGAVWRVAGWTLERMAIELRLRKEAGLSTAAQAVPGRATTSGDEAAGATRLLLLDLPAADDGAVTPNLLLAAAGTGAGWRRASASLSLDGGASWQAVGQTALPAIMGQAATVLPDGPAMLFDRRGRVEIELLNAGMSLVGADDAALVAGANLALIGDELIQFGSAEQIGPARFRLSRLLRGRRGSEAAAGLHAVGDRFVLIDPARLLPLDIAASTVGAEIRAMASGPGDGTAAETALRVIGRALRPPAPVRLAAHRQADGAIRFSWVRRSRAGWAWIDGSDAPLGEDSERYRLRIEGAGASARVVEIGEPVFDYEAAMQAADGVVPGGPIGAELVQLGTRGASLPAQATWIM